MGGAPSILIDKKVASYGQTLSQREAKGFLVGFIANGGPHPEFVFICLYFFLLFDCAPRGDNKIHASFKLSNCVYAFFFFLLFSRFPCRRLIFAKRSEIESEPKEWMHISGSVLKFLWPMPTSKSAERSVDRDPSLSKVDVSFQGGLMIETR